MQDMTHNRWDRILVALSALLSACVSVTMGLIGFVRAKSSSFTPVLAGTVMEGILLHLCALALLLFGFVALRKHPYACAALWLAVFTFLVVSACYALDGPCGLPAKGASRWVGMLALASLPLPLLALLRGYCGASRRLILWLSCATGAAAAVVLLTLAIGIPKARFSVPLPLIATLAAVLSILWPYTKNRRKCRARLLNEATVGGFLLAAGLAAAAAVILADGYGLRFFRYGLLGLLLCLLFRYVRKQSECHQKLLAINELQAREEEYRIAVAHSGKFIMRFEIARRRLVYLPETAAFFGLEEVAENTPEAQIEMGKVVPQSADVYRDLYARMIRGEPSGSCVFGFYDRNGEVKWLHADFTTIFDQDGTPLHSVVSSYEIVGMQEREAAYDQARKSYHSLAPDTMVCYELDLTLDSLLHVTGSLLPPLPSTPNPTMREIVNYLASTWLCADDREELTRLLDRVHLLGCYEQDIRRESLDFRRVQNEQVYWTQALVQMIADPHSSNIRAFVVLKDIETEKNRELSDKKRSRTDELTGLLNRSSFIECFDELCQASAEGAHHAVIMIDLDGFKAVNDTFGHRFGDKVLIDVASDLQAIMRNDDLICRLGGDEYIICLKAIPVDGSFLDRRCQAICHALGKQFGEDVAISASLGVSIYPNDGATFDELYHHSDQALYSAKQQGRNCYAFYNSSYSSKFGARGAVPLQTPKQIFREPREHRHTILIVDDQRINRAILREIFQSSYAVLEASNGREALDMLNDAQHTISAMILDLIMPEVSGLDVLRKMNEDAYYQTIPVIVVSAAAEDEYSLKAIELGAVDYVTKPIDERLVHLRVRNAISRRETENLRTRNRDLLVQRADETRHQNQLRYIAEHDSLTHICNKAAFYRRTRTMLDEKSARPFCIVSFDVQRFRTVNDIFGHDEGDRLLRHIAMLLRNTVGQNGTYSRIDTDNFAFCIPYRHDELLAFIDQLIRNLKEYNLSFEVQLSFGIYIIDDLSLTIHQMHARAEMAKQSVKDSFLRRWSFYDDTMRKKLLEEQDIVNCMNTALQDGEFVVYYQPKCRLDTGLSVGAEALVRWKHKQRGLLSPGLFVPIFEKNGFIMKLDIYVWEQVCAFLSRRRALDPNDSLQISVNISRANLYNPTLCHTLDGLCRKYGVPNHRMEVEITESAYVENAHLLLGLTDELHRYGFMVEMDDFGNGYSSLNMLKEIPVDALKLDMRFLYGIQNNERGGSILKSTISMARQLHLPVIAEGVESEEQARFLASVGCKLAQGYYYALPMCEEDFVRSLDNRLTIEDVISPNAAAAVEQLNRLLCGAALCARNKGALKLLNVNEYYMRMMRIQPESFDRVDAELNLWIGQEDQRLLKKAMDEARASGTISKCVYLQRDMRERYHLLRAMVRYMETHSEHELYLMTFEDASEDFT